MPLSNKAFNFFIFNTLYNLPAVIILPFLRNYNVKIKLLRFFVITYIKFITNVSFFVNVFLN